MGTEDAPAAWAAWTTRVAAAAAAGAGAAAMLTTMTEGWGGAFPLHHQTPSHLRRSQAAFASQTPADNDAGGDGGASDTPAQTGSANPREVGADKQQVRGRQWVLRHNSRTLDAPWRCAGVRLRGGQEDRRG